MFQKTEPSEYEDLLSTDRFSGADSPSSDSSEKASLSKSAFLPPCRVCHSPASGFHYGVNTCEACKTFFRRTLVPGSTIKPCKKGNRCLETIVMGKISCSSCRYKKCKEVGMNKQGCKKGRYTYEKRINDLREIDLINSSSKPSQDGKEDIVAMNAICSEITNSFSKHFSDNVNFYKTRKTHIMRVDNLLSEQFFPIFTSYLSTDNCDTTIPTGKHWLHGLGEVDRYLTQAFSDGNSQQCKKDEISRIVWTALSSELEQIVLSCGSFAKNLSKFRSLLMQDKMTLVKSAFSELLLITQAHMWRFDIDALIRYDSFTDHLYLIPATHLTDVIFRSETLVLIRSCVERIAKMNLNSDELALLAAIILCSPDRQQLQDADSVKCIQQQFINALSHLLKKKHPEGSTTLTDCLMLLPTIRECGMAQKADMERLANQFNIYNCGVVSPLLLEVLHSNNL